MAMIIDQDIPAHLVNGTTGFIALKRAPGAGEAEAGGPIDNTGRKKGRRLLRPIWKERTTEKKGQKEKNPEPRHPIRRDMMTDKDLA